MTAMILTFALAAPPCAECEAALAVRVQATVKQPAVPAKPAAPAAKPAAPAPAPAAAPAKPAAVTVKVRTTVSARPPVFGAAYRATTRLAAAPFRAVGAAVERFRTGDGPARRAVRAFLTGCN